MSFLKVSKIWYNLGRVGAQDAYTSKKKAYRWGCWVSRLILQSDNSGNSRDELEQVNNLDFIRFFLE